MKDNVPVNRKDGQQLVDALNSQGETVQLNLNDRYNSRTNPLTGQVVFSKDGEHFKVGYKARKEFETKFIPEFRAKHEANKDTDDGGQKLRRNKEAEDRLWREKAKEEVYKPKLSVSVVSPWNMKSDEADLFANRARDLEKHQAVYGESDHSKIMKEIQTRGKHPMGDRLRNGTGEYKDLHLQHINKIKPAYH